MNKALLTIVCAASLAVPAFAATPVDLTVEITTGSVQETLRTFNLKFLKNGEPWDSGIGAITIDTEKTVTVTGNGLEVKSESYGTQFQFGSFITVNLESTLSTPGTYTINVPAGLVTAHDETNKALSVPITISGSSVSMSQKEYMSYFMIDPADGSSLGRLGTFTLISSNGAFKFDPSTPNATLKAPDGEIYYSAPTSKVDDTQMEYFFSAPATTPGAYIFTIPEGQFTSTLPGRGETKNPELVFNYTVKSTEAIHPIEPDIARSPLNTTFEADSFSSFYMSVTDGDDALGPFIINSDLYNKVKVQCASAAFFPSSIINVPNDPKTIEFRFTEPITVGGDYSITLPQGLLAWDEFLNSEVTLDNAFKCTGPEVNYYVDPTWYRGMTWSGKLPIENDEVTALTGVYGSFTNIPADAKLVIPMEGVDEDQISTVFATIELPSGEVLRKRISPVVQDDRSFRIAISDDMSGYKIEGPYTITIPCGSFTVNGLNNPEIVKVLRVSDNRVYTPVKLNVTPYVSSSEILSEFKYFNWVWNNTTQVDGVNKDIYHDLGINPNKSVKVTTPNGQTLNVKAFTYGRAGYLGFEILVDPALTANGIYTVEIPEGLYRMQRNSDDVLCCNEAMTYTYQVKAATPASIIPSVNPAPGVYASLNRFEFYRPAGYTMYIPTPAKPFILTCPDGSQVSVNPSTNPNVEGDYIFAVLEQPATEVGEYTLSIPEGGIELYNVSEQLVSFNGASFKYTVKEMQPADLAFEADPANNSTLYSLPYVYVKFEEPVTFTVGKQAEVTNPAGESEKVSTSFNAANNRLLLTFGYNNELGEYTLTIPEGTVATLDGRINKEIKLHYNYIEREVKNIDFILDPKQGIVESFQTVTISFPENIVAVERMDHGNTKVTYTIDDEKGEEILFVREVEESKTKFTVSFKNAITVREGDRKELVITIPEGTFICTYDEGSQAVNAVTRLVWRIVGKSGVAGIYGDSEAVTVYTLDGKCLLRNAEPAALETLEKGTYIINGKTTVII